MAKLTGELLHRELNKGIYIPPVSLFGVDLPNITSVACMHDPFCDSLRFVWKTIDNKRHEMNLPWGEISDEELQALFVAMRIS